MMMPRIQGINSLSVQESCHTHPSVSDHDRRPYDDPAEKQQQSRARIAAADALNSSLLRPDILSTVLSLKPKLGDT